MTPKDAVRKLVRKIKTGPLRRLKNPWAKTSFSQCGEDLIVKFIFDALQIKDPGYIDIGAHHPFYLSNTALFHQLGSKGINVEPDPNLFTEFVKYRKGDVNLNIGIGAERAEADFYIISSPTLNTFSKKEAENYKNIGDHYIKQVTKVPINTLKNIIEEYAGGKFPAFLNVDAEGVDELIIRSIDYENNYPLVMCIETLSFAAFGKGVKNEALISYVLSKGYKIYADTYINTIFIRGNILQD